MVPVEVLRAIPPAARRLAQLSTGQMLLRGATGLYAGFSNFGTGARRLSYCQHFTVVINQRSMPVHGRLFLLGSKLCMFIGECTRG